MVVKLIIIIIAICLFGSLCLALGLFIASTKINSNKNKLYNEPECKTYRVKVRYLQSTGFTKSYDVQSISSFGAIAQVLKICRYGSWNYELYSVVSVKELN